MGYSRKNPNREGWGYTFLKTPWNFFTLTLEVPDKTKLNPWIFHIIVLDPLEILRPKIRALEIPHYYFLITLGNSTSFLINPWKFHMLFIWYPWKFHILDPPVWIFSRIAQSQFNSHHSHKKRIVWKHGPY